MNAVETDLHPFAGQPAASNGPLDRGQIHSCRLGSGRLPITILCERILRGKMLALSRGEHPVTPSRHAQELTQTAGRWLGPPCPVPCSPRFVCASEIQCFKPDPSR